MNSINDDEQVRKSGARTCISSDIVRDMNHEMGRKEPDVMDNSKRPRTGDGQTA